MEDYEKKYKEAMARMESWARGEHPECFSESQKAAEFVFPELMKSEDEKIKEDLIAWFKNFPDPLWRNHWVKEVIAWIRDHAANPFTGTGFDFNNHHWGMCARDGGIEVILDGNIVASVDFKGNVQLTKCANNFNVLAEKRDQLKSVNSLDALNWKPASEIPTAHWELNNSISTLYLVKCEGNQEGKPIIGYARYSFATDRWMDCIHTTGDGIGKVIEWLDDGAEYKTAIGDSPKFMVQKT